MPIIYRYILAVALLPSLPLRAQETTTQQAPRTYGIVSLGLGLGQNYGGLGGNLTVYPQKHIGVFGSYGLLGYNAGLKLRFFNPAAAVPRSHLFLTGMYGYNLVVKVRNASDYNKTFHGYTAGVGFDSRFTSGKQVGHWSFALLVPIRGSETNAYLRQLRRSGVEIAGPWPVTFSVGFNFVIH